MTRLSKQLLHHFGSKRSQDDDNPPPYSSLEKKERPPGYHLPPTSLKDLPHKVICFIVTIVYDLEAYRQLAKIKFFHLYLSESIGLITESGVTLESVIPLIPKLSHFYCSELSNRKLKQSKISTFIVSLPVSTKVQCFAKYFEKLMNNNKSFCLEFVGDRKSDRFPRSKIECFKDPFLQETSRFVRLSSYLKEISTRRVPTLSIYMFSPSTEKQEEFYIEAYYFFKFVFQHDIRFCPGNDTTGLMQDPILLNFIRKSARNNGRGYTLNNIPSLKFLNLQVDSSSTLNYAVNNNFKYLSTLKIATTKDCQNVTLKGYQFLRLETLIISTFGNFEILDCRFPKLKEMSLNIPLGTFTIRGSYFNSLNVLNLQDSH